jgi:glycopeptide antibiotics resistance protein
VYGCLYPWEFRSPPPAFNPLVIVAHASRQETPRRFIADLCINIALFMPLGILAHLVFGRRKRKIAAIAGPVLLGFALSLGIEMAQVYTVSRYASILDVLWNTLGAALGVAVASAARAVWDSKLLRRRPHIEIDSGAIVLLLCWIAFLFFPLVPALNRVVLRNKFQSFIDPRFDAVSFLSAAITWFIIGRLIALAGARPPAAWLGAAAVIAVPAQIIVVTRQPALSAFAGAVAGFLLFAVFGRKLRSRTADAWLAVSLLAVRGLLPFRLTIDANSFTWLPFGGVLGYDWQRAFVVLLEKVFYYGAAIWALRRAGTRLSTATAITAALLACIEVFQIHLKGRTPEVTDVLMAVIIGVTVSIFSSPR